MIRSRNGKPILLSGLAVLALQGCPTVTPVASVGPPKLYPLAYKPDPVCAGQNPQGPYTSACPFERLQSLAYAPLGKESVFNMQGSGTCGEVSFDPGDGTPPKILTNVSFAQGQGWQVRHTYTGWPGKKLVRVKGLRDCLADASTEISVGFEPDDREEMRNAFRPNTMQCNPVMLGGPSPQAMPAIRKGSGVRIETSGALITYGGPQLAFNASGDPSAATPQNWTFPNHRKFSLVYRVGSQLVQGEVGPVVFRATETAPLEVCVNDDPLFLADNTGGMLVTITVNESSAE
jgi:hypothetical protein